MYVYMYKTDLTDCLLTPRNSQALNQQTNDSIPILQLYFQRVYMYIYTSIGAGDRVSSSFVKIIFVLFHVQHFVFLLVVCLFFLRVSL